VAPANDFRHCLRAARLAAGLTQEALAERAAMSVRAIQNLERGERRPYPETTERLVAALDLQGHERTSFDELARTRPRTRASQPTQPVPVDRARADHVGMLARQRLGQAAFEFERTAAAQLSLADLEAELDRVSGRQLSVV
jgi:transcriptional regulator with XRE-family HTH domain